MASVTIDNLRKDYGATRVLHDVGLQVGDGEFVALIGPSGCGKSTLLRSIAGLEGITGGDIRIGERLVTTVPPRDRDIAMVFQNYALYPHMTVAQNMGFSLKLRGADPAEITAKVGRAAEILGLGALLGRFPRQLSGGQRQRVAMGRAIVRDPQVFLFDEPLSNLDAKLRVQMRSEIRRLQKALGATVIYVTHDQVEAMTMADRIVVMRGGHIEQQGAPLELFDRPRTGFVAGFIGSPAMNMLDGRIVAAGFETRAGTLVALPRTDMPGCGQREAVLGIRPEHLELSDAPDATPATLLLVEPLGSETLLLLDLDGQEVQLLLRGRTTLAAGTGVGLRARPGTAHFFETRDGARIG
ncbi:ABC transporter ATP-binding protein [Frigidibacter sp. MR17.24]|uniref:ABC transporter ATP-binding protein n=1 Tax=Frigidibacter sp. MR17.24 TaxID=3127345 RepID=UPI003013132D